jgi:hemoglobin
MNQVTLYENLGGYDGIEAFVNNLLPRLKQDKQLSRFWQNRGDDGMAREKQLLIDYLCASSGGPLYYTGRSMNQSHTGMKISESDWNTFIGHAVDTMNCFQLTQHTQDAIAAFVNSLKPEIVEI